MRRSLTLGIEIPKTWEELVELQKELGVYGGATRFDEDQDFYDTFQEVVPREFILELIRKQMKGEEVAIVKNNFPYSLILKDLHSVQHYILWSLKGPVEEGVGKAMLEERFPGKKWITFITIPENKSIPELWHMHIMVSK